MANPRVYYIRRKKEWKRGNFWDEIRNTHMATPTMSIDDANSSSVHSRHKHQRSQPAQKKKGAEIVHIIDQPWTLANWHQHLNWLNVVILGFPPILALYGLFTTQIQYKTAAWAIIYYFMTGFGITVGYHRLWSHRSYSATPALRIILAALGGGAVEGSVRWWSRDHRAHHRYTDTTKDPYSVRKGLLYAHLGWMLIKQDPKRIGRTDIADLNADPIVRFQHRYYLFVMLLMGFALPTIVAGLGWNDWRGGFYIAAVCRLVFVHHATFCVNSLAHWLGDQPFDDRNSPRDHVFTALMTLGEGYHNMHHEFPSDYRNALKWYQYDPSKWCILVFKAVGLAYNLQTFPHNEIEKGRLQQRQNKLDRERGTLNWGTPVHQLPVMDYEDFEQEASTGRRNLVLVAGIAHDVTEFIRRHPGGEALIKSGIGRDMTAAFNGGIYDHSNAAHNLLSTMRIAVVRGGGEVDIWRTASPDFKASSEIVRAGMQATRLPAPIGAAAAS